YGTDGSRGRVSGPCSVVEAPISARYAKRPERWSGVLRGDGGDCEPHPWGSPLPARYAKRSFDGAARYMAMAGIVNPIPGVHPFAPCATGPTCGRPNSFRTNLSNPSGFVHSTLSARYAKRPVRGVLRIWRRGWDSNPRYAYTYA